MNCYKSKEDLPEGYVFLPGSKCHPTEEECALSCPPVPFCQCDEPNVLGNELTMTLQDVADTGYTPSETENITCTPEQLISQINAMSFNAPFLMWRWQGIPGNVLPPPDGTDFDEAVWGTESNDPSEGLQASAQCVNLGAGRNNPISCAIDEELGTSCLQYFEEDQFFGKVEWTPYSVKLSVGGSQAGTDQRICDFSNTGSTLLEFSKLSFQDPFFVNGRWENLNYVGGESTGPRFKNIRLAEFTADMLLSINGAPPGGRIMPTKTTTGPGTELAAMLKAWGIKSESGCKCKSMERSMNKWGSNCAKEPHLTTILDHLQKEAKKRKLPFVRTLAKALVLRAVKRFENNS